MSNKRGYKKLGNGMRIAYDPMTEIESVAVSFMVTTGAKHERPEQNGISHFLEHMAFKGTKRRNARQIAEEFDRIGGHFNAYTSKERTVYYAKVLKENLETAVDILSDILQHSTLSTEEIDKERNVILQELAQTNDTPDDIVFEMFQEAAYPDQAIGRSILGTEELIKSATRQQLVEYIETRYGYNNLSVSGAGNLDATHLCKLVEDRMTAMPKHSSTVKSISNYQGGDARKERDLEQIHTVLGLPGVSYHDDDYFTQQVLAVIAGGGMSSRLFQEVREKRGLAYHISAFSSSYEDTGIFGIYASSNDKDTNELLDVSIGEVQKMMQDLEEDELLRAKAQVRAHMLMAQESSVARAEKFASNLALFDRYIAVQEMIEKIEAVDIVSVQRFIKTMLSTGRPTLSSIGKIRKLYQYDTIVEKIAV